MEAKAFIPYQIVEVELSRPLMDLKPQDGYERQPVMVLARLHGQPLGVLELEIEAGGMRAEELAGRIQKAFGQEIRAHLSADGLEPAPDSIPVTGQPQCIRKREQFLAKAPYASVLIATHNRIETLGPCLDSLLAMDYPHFDIIVIDNAPTTNDTAAFVNKYYWRSGRVRYVREDHAGLASAHNRGLAATSAPYVAITDDDVTVDRYWLAEMMKGFVQAENVGCVTGMIFPAEIATRAQYWIEHSVGYAKGFAPRPFDLSGHRPDNPLFPYAAGMFGSGANMAFKTSVIRELGGFDDSLGAGSVALGGDDLAAFFSVIAAGYTLVYEPSAIVYHRHYREYERLRKTAYGYGAGLTAYLTGVILDRPGRIVEIARKFPRAVRYAFGANSPKNTRKAKDYPPELTRIERKGMLAGPVLYLRSRWNTRSLVRRRLETENVETAIQEIKRGS